jgi:hypothetical protein
MAQPTQYNSYDLVVGVIVDIEDMIHLLDAVDVPLLGGQGADGRSALSAGTCFETKVEWIEEEILLPKSKVVTLAASGTLTVTTGEGIRFGVGDVVAVNAERLLVTAISGDVITADRGYAGTTAASATAGTVVLIIGQALAEGSDPEAPRAKDRATYYNHTQIFGPTAVRVSGTENVVRKYGLVGSEFDKQVANRTKEAYIQQEQALLYGKRNEASEKRTMGGIDSYITTNVNTGAVALTEALLLDQIQACWDAGGSPDRITLGAKQKRDISKWNVGLQVNTMRTDDGRGSIVDYVDSDFGRVSLLLNRWCRSTDLFIYDRDQASVDTLRPMQFEMLAKTGDSIHGQIVCEKTLRFRRQRHAAKFTALT